MKKGELEMIQVCEPPRQRQVRRLSAEEFCTLVQQEVCSAYRPRSEVLRMLAVGEVWGNDGAALMIQPLNADTAAAQALRECLGWRRVNGGYFLTTPVVQKPEKLAALLRAAAARAVHLARRNGVWAVLECTSQAERLLPLYLKQGFALRALRPLESLAPSFLLTQELTPAQAEPVWVPLEDRAHLALRLARGYAAVDCRTTPQGLVLAMLPV